MDYSDIDKLLEETIKELDKLLDPPIKELEEILKIEEI